MKVIYVCSPYRPYGETKSEELTRNFNYAMELTKRVLTAGYYPITPHLYIMACLDDTKPDERMIGTGAALALLERCDAVMIGERYGISEGMAAEIEKAKQLNIPVFYRDRNIADFKNLTIVCDKSSGYAKTRIIQDDVELQRVTSFSFTHEGGENPVLNVDMVEPEKECETSENET